MYQGTVSGMKFSGYLNFSYEIYLYYSLHIFYWFYFLPKEVLAKILLKCILRVCVMYNNMKCKCTSIILICTLIAVYMQCELRAEQGEVREGRRNKNTINRLSRFGLRLL